MKKGFTLAEVLITLVIIGVIAAMTIPTLINSTGDQEYKTGLKKAFATLNQVISVNAVLGEYTPTDVLGSTLTELLKDKMASIATPASPNPITGCDSMEGPITTSSQTNWVYTTDGFRYYVTGSEGFIIVDTNGDKGPNRCMKIENGDDKCAKAVVYSSGDSFALQINAETDLKNYAKELLPGDNASSCVLYGRQLCEFYGSCPTE